MILNVLQIVQFALTFLICVFVLRCIQVGRSIMCFIQKSSCSMPVWGIVRTIAPEVPWTAGCSIEQGLGQCCIELFMEWSTVLLSVPPTLYGSIL